MKKALDRIEAEILALPEEDRAYLVDVLIASLEPPEEMDPEWMAELHRRREEVIRGEAELIDNEEVLARLLARLR